MQTNNITQTVLSYADNPELLGNKIKLRDESYRNFVGHVRNVAFQGSSLKPEITQPDFTILPSGNSTASYNGSKPINVKESMLTGISSHAKVEQPSVDPIEVPIVNPEVEESKNVSTVNQVPIQNEVNVNDRFAEISNARQLVQDVMARADQAQQEAIQSEETLNKLSIEEAEAQKKLEEAEARKKIIEEKIRKALSEQADTLDVTRKKYEDLIVEANNKRDQSVLKIEDFKGRINSTNDKLSQIENEIANNQQILDALTQFDFSNNTASQPMSSNAEENENRLGRKIA